MNIFKHEFKQKIKSMFVWTASIILWAAIVIAFIPSMIEMGDEFSQMLSKMGAYGEIFSINVNTFSSVMGIIGMYFGMLLLIFGIQAANYGYGLVSIEESELTADFLLTKPVKRPRIMTYKILAALSALLCTSIIYIGASYAMIMAVAGDSLSDKKALILVLVSAIFVQLFFFSVGILVSLFLKKVKSVIPYSMGTVFGLYILSAFARSFEIEFLEYINPFSFFDAAKIAQDAKYDMTFFIINIVIIVICIAASYILYQKRNIRSL